ncbi:acyl-ACP--UDP-N-acetylglucosamine O-acyltransferase [Elusimicrobiota bacterium]
MKIHPSAIIEKGAELDNDVIVGPYAVIRGAVKIGSGTAIDAHTVIEGNTTIGKNNRIGIGAVIGNAPQDLKYNGENTEVIIGEGNAIREYVTINRGTVDRMKTVIGNGNLLMSYVHIGHDALIADEVIMGNCVTLAGHITIEEQAIIGGLTPIHQFVRIGRMSITGGASRVQQDIPPYCKTSGNPMKIFGLNVIGLNRRNYSVDDKNKLKKAYKILFRSGLNTSQALDRIKSDATLVSAHVKYLVKFIEDSKRGICKK